MSRRILNIFSQRKVDSISTKMTKIQKRLGIVVLLVIVYMPFRSSGSGSLGSSVVSCATCQAVQVHLQHLTCDVNCRVVKGNKGRYLTTFNDLQLSQIHW